MYTVLAEFLLCLSFLSYLYEATFDFIILQEFMKSVKQRNEYVSCYQIEFFLSTRSLETYRHHLKRLRQLGGSRGCAQANNTHGYMWYQTPGGITRFTLMQHHASLNYCKDP